MALSLLITLNHRARNINLSIEVEGPATIGEVVDAIVRQASLVGTPRRPALAVRRTGATLPRETRLSDADVRSGDRCWLNDAPDAQVAGSVPAAAVAEIVEGPGSGTEFELRPGPSDVGRAAICEITIDDELASRRHARINVGDEIRVHDLGSTNGVMVNDEMVAAATRVDPDDRITIGDTVLRVRSVEAPEEVPAGPSVPFNRPPHVVRPFDGRNVQIPAPPSEPQKQRFSITAALVPLVMVLGMYLYYTQRDEEFPMIFLAFMLMSPIMVVGTYYENRGWGQREHRDQLAHHSERVAQVIAELDTARQEESASRKREYPSAAEAMRFAVELAPRLWERHPDEGEFLALRVGSAEQRSRTSVEVETGGSLKLRSGLEEIPLRYERIPELPAVASLSDLGGLGIAGPVHEANALARALMVQVAGLHAPSDVAIASLMGEQESQAWEWLSWLPHARSAVSPITGTHFGVGVAAAASLLNELLDVLAKRHSAREDYREGDGMSPAVVVLIDESAPVDRTRLLPLLETGPPLGLHFIWLASSRTRLPRACGSVVDLHSGRGDAVLGLRALGEEVRPVAVETLPADDAEALARSLAPVTEVGGRVGAAASLPSRVSLVELLGGTSVAEDPDVIVDRWRQGDEQLQQGKVLRLRAPIGRQADAPLSIDIRTDGPHALVAGTTGAGKSELLQSYVASLAATHSAEHVTFLFIDYKGGAAFKDCVELPHAVGLVTDLNTSEVRRALVSLEAELRHRERILNDAGAKDLMELESMGHRDAPPTLLVIVDEFAALANEVPEFIEGIVDVALRGRSLGIHLILATQRPAGVVTPQIRANTSLRIALRVADDDDSSDIIGTSDAAVLPTDRPGRAYAKLGPRDSVLFQSAYAGGFTPAASSGPAVTVSEFEFDHRGPLSLDAESGAGPVAGDATDLQRLVANIQSAHNREGIGTPRRPWQPPLAPMYDLARLPRPETDADVVLGVADLPRQQRQAIAHFTPDESGSLLVLGGSGSGKTVLLRTLAAAVGMPKAGPTTHVYALDFAGRGLEVLGDLPHVGAVVHGHDSARVVRLLRDLRTRINERGERWAAVRASSLPEYRAAAGGVADEPRIVVLLDGYAAFHSVYERVEGGKWLDWLTQLVADGRQFGVHFVLTADRRGAFPLALTSAAGSRLVLRLAHQDEYASAGIPVETAAALSAPGRAIFNDLEMQVALLGGDEAGDAQTAAMSDLAAYLQEKPIIEPSPVRVLPEEVAVDALPASSEAFVIGVRDTDLGPLALQFTAGGFVVCGPPRSGKTTALETLVDAVPQAAAGAVIVAYHGGPLTQQRPDCRVALGIQDGARLLRDVLDGDSQDLLVVVDDLHEFAHTDVDAALSDILRNARNRRLMVVASSTAELARRAFDGALRDIRANKAGILLQPDAEVDGDIVGLRLPRTVNAAWPAGRGYAVLDGSYELCQIARPRR